jgi:hypothetical protein
MGCLVPRQAAAMRLDSIGEIAYGAELEAPSPVGLFGPIAKCGMSSFPKCIVRETAGGDQEHQFGDGNQSHVGTGFRGRKIVVPLGIRDGKDSGSTEHWCDAGTLLPYLPIEFGPQWGFRYLFALGSFCYRKYHPSTPSLEIKSGLFSNVLTANLNQRAIWGVGLFQKNSFAGPQPSSFGGNQSVFEGAIAALKYVQLIAESTPTQSSENDRQKYKSQSSYIYRSIFFVIAIFSVSLSLLSIAKGLDLGSYLGGCIILCGLPLMAIGVCSFLYGFLNLSFP